MRWNSLILIGVVGMVAAACADDRDPFAPSSKTSAALPSNMTTRAILDCVGTVAGARGVAVTCQPATADGPAAAADPALRQEIAESVTLGRQNIDLTLAFSGYAFSSGVFSAKGTEQNLLNQTMGDSINGH